VSVLFTCMYRNINEFVTLGSCIVLIGVKVPHMGVSYIHVNAMRGCVVCACIFVCVFCEKVHMFIQYMFNASATRIQHTYTHNFSHTHIHTYTYTYTYTYTRSIHHPLLRLPTHTAHVTHEHIYTHLLTHTHIHIHMHIHIHRFYSSSSPSPTDAYSACSTPPQPS
jgi:hypothetical protein